MPSFRGRHRRICRVPLQAAHVHELHSRRAHGLAPCICTARHEADSAASWQPTQPAPSWAPLEHARWRLRMHTIVGQKEVLAGRRCHCGPASSNARHLAGSTPSVDAARRNGSGSGLCFSQSSAQTTCLAGEQLNRDAMCFVNNSYKTRDTMLKQSESRVIMPHKALADAAYAPAAHASWRRTDSRGPGARAAWGVGAGSGAGGPRHHVEESVEASLREEALHHVPRPTGHDRHFEAARVRARDARDLWRHGTHLSPCAHLRPGLHAGEVQSPTRAMRSSRTACLRPPTCIQLRLRG